jgi:PHP family Zn ribbon phosphoesterase
MAADGGGYFSARIDVGVTSDAQFNVISHLDGPHNRFLRYIEEQTHCRASVHGALHFGVGSEEEGPLHILVLADSEDDVAKAREHCENVIATVRAQRQQSVQLKAARRIKKRKAGKGVLVLPDQLIAAMKCYFPGDDAEPPPPGSAEDVKQHKANFRSVGKQLGWFHG